ncbi:polycomb group protein FERTILIZATION-INDEPENDENT ENDOSPERM-like [Raphanus sativus]|uniref:Polycomb group protein FERTILIZATION-INDEPENDENT ENDOSPERM-like n=1 Tax=Raphanus sativus TaxID=3726 RepID=A0A9W3DTH1_RAPSA|nr:polycomb group protein FERTILIZATION-INDEPENDENT ENDOSPERM-like [Raphanus sativus]
MSEISLWNESLVAGSLTPSNQKTYKVTKRVHEGKKPLCSVVFNFIDPRFYNFFVTAGGNGINMYNCLEDGGISSLHSYTDEDKEESFYTASWTCSLLERNPFVAAGGLKGRIRVLNLQNNIIKTLVGHQGSVNEIKTHPMIPQLVLSASNDGTVRLWNVETGICVLVFAGSGGHESAVLSVDFHPYDMHRFVSCCMKTTTKVWSMKEFGKHVDESFTWKDDPKTFQTQVVQFPVFTASDRMTIVECNCWVGDYILSKSMTDKILLWQPQLKENSPGEVTLDVLCRYPIPKSYLGHIKFSCDLPMNYVSIGNQKGKIYVWDLKTRPPVLITVLSHYQSKSLIKQTAMSTDGNTILAASEDGTLWRWDVKRV